MEPWYVALNPKAYVPTLIYGKDHTPICESTVIMQQIDDLWEGKVKLQKECIENQEIMDRYKELL